MIKNIGYKSKLYECKLAEDILSALDRRIVVFEYLKKDGTIVRRRGTRSKSHMPVGAWRGVKRANHRSTDNVIVYWDFYRNAWRSFRARNFLRELPNSNVYFKKQM